MRKFVKCLSFFLVMTIFVTISNQSVSAVSYKKYKNERFGYTIQYPKFFLQSKPLPQNGDGITMSGKKAELLLYGSYAVVYSNGKEMRKSFEEYGKKMLKVKATEKSLYYEEKVSRGKKVRFYYSYFVNGGIISMELTCRKNKKTYYKKIVRKMMKSIRKNKTFY